MVKSQARTNKEVSDNNTLVLYRLDNVEQALKDLTTKVDRQDNIKKADLNDLRDTIISRVVDAQASLQKQIDTLDEGKANTQELIDFKKQVAGYAAFISALAIAAFSYMLTRLK